MIYDKQCVICGNVKSLLEFYKTRNWYRNCCKVCDNKRRMTRYYEHWLEERKRSEEWKLEHPEYNKEWIREYRRKQKVLAANNTASEVNE